MIFLKLIKSSAGIALEVLASLTLAIVAVLSPSPEAIGGFMVAFFALLYALLSDGSVDEFKKLKKELSAVDELVTQGKPKTAKDNLRKLLSSFEATDFSPSQKNELYSGYHYLLGLCLLDLGADGKSGFEEIVKGYLRSDKTHLGVQEKAIRAYINLNNTQDAAILIDDVLKVDPYNAVAWASKVEINGDFAIDLVPEIVTRKLNFKYYVSAFLLRRHKFDEAKEICSADWQYDISNLRISMANYKYYAQLALFQFNQYFQGKTVYIDAPDDSDIKADGEFTRISSLLSKLHDFFEGREIYQNHFYLQIALIHYFSEFTISEKKEGILKSYEILMGDFKYKTEKVLLQTAISLYKCKELEKAIELCGSGMSDLDLLLIKGRCETKIGRQKDALQTYREAIGRIHAVSAHEMAILFMVISVYRQSGEDAYELMTQTIDEKIFERAYQKQLLLTFSKSFSCESPQEVYDGLAPALESSSDLFYAERIAVAEAMFRFGYFKECEEVLESIIDIGIESGELQLYIDAICNRKADHEKILRFLTIWNDSYTVYLPFLAFEIEIQSNLGNAGRVEKLAAKGFQNSPTLFFFWNLIVALYSSKKYSEIKSLLERVDDYELTYDLAFRLARICFRMGENETGCRVAYKYALKNRENVVSRERYFNLMSVEGEGKMPNPEVIENDTTIRVSTEDGNKLIHIIDSTIETNSFIPHFLGKKVGDIVKIEEPVTGSKKTYQVLQILNKYTGLVAEIADSVSHGTTLDGYTMVTFNVPDSSDVKAMEELFIEKFGENGQIRRLLTEDAFKKYYNAQITFSELVISVNKEEPLSIFHYLTSGGDFFRTVPLKMLETVDYSKVKEFVIDLTSLPVLVELSKQVHVNRKFIISSFLVEHLKEKVQELERVKEDQLSITVLINEVRKHVTSQREIEYKRDRYLKYLSWIEGNCIIEYAPRRLDLLNQMKREDMENWYFDYWCDTVFLANSDTRCLITDDEINYSRFFHLARPMPTEGFILASKFFSAQLINDLFVARKYVGIQIAEENLRLAFDSQAIFEKNVLLRNCLSAANFSYHQNKRILYESIKFLKYIYSLPLRLTYKNFLAKALLNEVLKAYPKDMKLGAALASMIRKQFKFLGDAELEILNVVNEVMEIHNFSSS